MGPPVSPQALTRERAKAVLERNKSLEPQIVELDLTQEQMRQGDRLGYWRLGRNFGDQQIALTPSGSRFFSRFQLFGRTAVVTKEKLQPYIVAITGLTNDPAGSKVVELRWSWKWDKFPADLQTVFQSTVWESTASFQLYDDGWRTDWNPVRSPSVMRQKQ